MQGHERLCYLQVSRSLYCWPPLFHCTSPSHPSLPSPPFFPGPHLRSAFWRSIGMGDGALRLKAEVPLGLHPHPRLSHRLDEIPSWMPGPATALRRMSASSLSPISPAALISLPSVAAPRWIKGRSWSSAAVQTGEDVSGVYGKRDHALQGHLFSSVCGRKCGSLRLTGPHQPQS